jgi:predicted site-specific integrase-resolvase
MSLTQSWYTIEQAAAKYGLATEQIKVWIDRGLIRTEGHKGDVIMVNINDIEQELHLVPSI